MNMVFPTSQLLLWTFCNSVPLNHILYPIFISIICLCYGWMGQFVIIRIWNLENHCVLWCQSEANQMLMPIQGGGQKGRSAIDQATQQVVEHELIHLNQLPALDLFLDLWHCFNYMVKACHNMACWRHGAADDYLRLHTQTHHLMRYYVQHKYGVSHDYNTYADHPWHGVGQGAADAVLRYIALSNTLIEAYHTKVAPQMISNPSNSLTIIQSLKAFIDDVVLHATQAHTSYLTLQQQVQSRLRWWNQIVHVMGGALNHKKCGAITYYWKPDKHGILALSQPDEAEWKTPITPNRSRPFH